MLSHTTTSIQCPSAHLYSPHATWAQASKLKRTEELLRESTKDAILARRDAQSAQERALSDGASAASERAALSAELAALRRKASEDVRSIKQQGDSKLDDVGDARGDACVFMMSGFGF